MSEQSEQAEQFASILDGKPTPYLLALQVALAEKLTQEREKIEALASALGGSCSFKNGPSRRKGKRSSTTHDDA